MATIMGDKASFYQSVFQISIPWLYSFAYNACPCYLKSRRDLLYCALKLSLSHLTYLSLSLSGVRPRRWVITFTRSKWDGSNDRRNKRRKRPKRKRRRNSTIFGARRRMRRKIADCGTTFQRPSWNYQVRLVRLTALTDLNCLWMAFLSVNDTVGKHDCRGWWRGRIGADLSSVLLMYNLLNNLLS